MKFSTTAIFLFLLVNYSFGQLDSSEFYAKIETLEKKLTYSYFNPDQKTWYYNRFDFDRDEQIVRFKSTSSKNPIKILGKKYTERIFSFEDLNPYNISLEQVDENRGLIVKGTLVRVETVKHEKLISKTINGEKGTPQSYIHFSIPKYMEDTSAGFSEGIHAILTEAVQFATNLRNKYDIDKNENLIFESLLGEHVAGNTKRFTQRHSRHLLQFEEYVNRQKIRDGLIGHDPVKGRYYEILIEENGEMMTSYYRVDMDSPDLVLVEVGEGSDNRIELVNKSMFQYRKDGKVVEYRPSGSF